jgi:hypothetical protein
MTTQSYTWPSNRQVLLNIGNRFVVFANPQTLPQTAAFNPNELTPPVSRVPDEQEIYEQRTVESVRVSGAQVRLPDSSDKGWDFEIIDPQGDRTFVEMKVRERDPKRIDYQQMFEQLRQYAGTSGRQLEIWNLNIERLVLQILRQDDRGIVVPIELTPIDVWDYGVKGEQPFHRSQVLQEVDEWAARLISLYANIDGWASKVGLGVERTRSVTMSEELMQTFAVPDRTLPILDIVQGDQPIVSFVPNGLWIIGAHGRVDVITRQGTRIVINTSPLKPGSQAEWRLIEQGSRNTVSFDEKTFTALITPP